MNIIISSCDKLDNSTIEIIFNTLAEKYNEDKLKKIDEKKKKLVLETLEENDDIKQFLEKNKIFHYKKLVNFICVLLPDIPAEQKGGDGDGHEDDEIVKYEKANYFDFNINNIKFDIAALFFLFVSIALILMANQNFMDFLEKSKLSSVNYNELILGVEKVEGVDITENDLTFFNFFKNSLFDFSCGVREKMETEIKKDLFDKLSTVYDSSMYKINEKCFTTISENDYINTFTKFIEGYYNPSQKISCSNDIAIQEMTTEFNKLTFDLKTTVDNISNSVLYIQQGCYLAVGSITYFSYRLGLMKMNTKKLKGEKLSIMSGGKSKKSKKSKKSRKSKKSKKSKKSRK